MTRTGARPFSSGPVCFQIPSPGNGWANTGLIRGGHAARAGCMPAQPDRRQRFQLRAAFLRRLPGVVDVLDLVDQPVAVMVSEPLDAAHAQRQARGLEHRRRIGVNGRRQQYEKGYTDQSPPPPTVQRFAALDTTFRKPIGRSDRGAHAGRPGASALLHSITASSLTEQDEKTMIVGCRSSIARTRGGCSTGRR